jgi:chemotaxis protein MotC
MIFCMAIAALIAGLPAARGAGPAPKKEDHGGGGHSGAKEEAGEGAPAVSKAVCFYSGEQPHQEEPAGKSPAATEGAPGGEPDHGKDHQPQEHGAVPSGHPDEAPEKSTAGHGADPAASEAAIGPGASLEGHPNELEPTPIDLPQEPAPTPAAVETGRELETAAGTMPQVEVPQPIAGEEPREAAPQREAAAEPAPQPAHQDAKPEAAAPSTDTPTPATEPPVAKDEALQPYRLVRTLETVQDSIAAGSREAHLYQRELISNIARALPSVADQDWREPRNSRAAIIFALSGGDPSILSKLLSLSPIPCVEDDLLKGLLEYSKGRSQEAQKLLTKIDPRSLDSRTGGHLALAQSMLVASEDPKKAVALLDIARLIAPGTLVEEAALRRESVLTAQVEDFKKFEMLASQYFRRFPKSVYANDFIRRFASSVVNGKYAESATMFQGLTEVFAGLEEEKQRFAYAAIAESAITGGRLQLALLAARKLADTAKTDAKYSLRAKLYEAAALLVGDDYDLAAAQLKSINRAELSPRDRPLLDAALALSARLRAPPQVDGPVTSPPVSAEQAKDDELSKPSPLVGKANEAISKADQLLSGDTR